MSDKEEAFIAEYKALLAKHHVQLVVETGEYESGDISTPIFKEAGRYCNIYYEPQCTRVYTGRHCMGG